MNPEEAIQKIEALFQIVREMEQNPK